MGSDLVHPSQPAISSNRCLMFQRDPHGLIGESTPFRRLLKAAQVVAATDANMLLQGEEGTGKEIVARAIHRMSPRRDRPFLTVACAGLPENQIESELGGGLDRAAGGSLFLDAVGELPPAGQSRLLRVLERGHDGSRPPRVIAATSHDLWSAVEAGSFRRDLYYRLYVVPLELPPLRERVQDIPLLLTYFVQSAAEANGLDRPRFAAAAERLLRRYAWPGNVRELKNFCERMVILFAGRDVGPENLPWEIRRGDMRAEEDLLFKLPSSGINLKDLEVEAIRQALALAGGNKSRAARLLGLTRDTLLYRMQKYLIRV
jgi:transcriptional regulator with GAF, ATPase, and Fis domain